MNLTAAFLFAICFGASASGFSQLLSLSEKDAKLEKVFKQINQQTGYTFVYTESLLKKSKTISLNVQNTPLEEVLRICFKEQPLTYTILNTMVVVKETEAPQTVTVNLPPVEVKGRITTENGEPLAGATVTEKKTKNSTSADGIGEFRLTVSNENTVLVITNVGYAPQEVKVSGNAASLNVVMKIDLKGMDDVVVIGYGGVRKSDVTGAVSSVKGKDLTAYPSANVVQALQGRSSGLLVQSNNGDPGGSYKIRIRGGTSVNASSDPIFVVDGFAGAVLPPPEDIESVEVLKDASATAIYGSRGANGVILVTTKKGKAGKVKIDVNSSYSTQTEINRLPLLNQGQFADYIKEANPSYVPGNANTDWQELIFRQGNIQNTQLSFSGGTDAVRYYVSGALYDQQGVLINSSFRRFSVTNNLDFTATKWLKVGLNLFAQSSKNVSALTQETSGATNSTGVVAGAFKFGPDQPVFRPDGTYSLAVVGDPTDNPVAVAKELQNQSKGSLYQFNVYADFALTKSLKFKTTLGSFANNQRTGQFIPTTLNAGRNVGGDASLNELTRNNLINENYLTYTGTFDGKHTVTALGGFSYQKFINEDFGARSQRFLSNSISFWDIDGGATALPGNSSLTESQLASYYGRLNYAFSNRYLLTFNARYDGSSNFSANNKWSFFPSAAFAWNMHNEGFMRNNRVVSSLKWRFSYGHTGNQAISPYQTLARFSSVYTFVNGAPVNAVRPTTIANDELKWETTAQRNIGVDIGFLKNRITLTADYYKSVTSDLLFNLPLPQYSGYTEQIKNIGKIENKGFEAALGLKNFVGAFQWNTDFNISFNRNKVLELPKGNDIIYAFAPGHMVGIGGSAQILRVGQPLGSFFGWVYDGVYQTGATFTPGSGFEQAAGGEKFRDIGGKKDANGKTVMVPDGVLNNDDRTIIGNPNPDFIWGLNNDLNFKNFDLNVFIQGSQGNDMLSYTLMELETLAANNNSTTEALRRWTPSNPNTAIPKVSAGRPQRVSTRWIFDGSYVRLKNLSMGYAFPKNLLQKWGMQRVRIYLSAQNIATITRYRGYDPEVNYRNSNLNAGTDYASYPNAKSFTAGVNIGF